MRIARWLAAVALLSPPLFAQEIQLRTSARTIVGIVRDSSGFELDAQVYLNGSKARTTSGADGRFRFTDVKPGTHQVAARRVGYYPQTKTVVVTDTGAAVEFVLVPLIRRLPMVVKTASRGGLSGIIGDTSYVALEGVEIWSTTASSQRAFTDARGTFFLDLHPGRHMVRVRKPGYETRIVSVTIPRDSGREILVNLGPRTRASNVQDQAMLEMAMRMTRRSPVYSSFMTRDDIAKLGFKELPQLVNAGAGHPVDDGCWAVTDGFARSLPLWLLSAGDIEALEVYANPPRSMARSRQASKTSNSRVVPRGPEGCPQVYVWLRK